MKKVFLLILIFSQSLHAQDLMNMLVEEAALNILKLLLKIAELLMRSQ